MSTYSFSHLKVNDKFLHQIKVIQTYQQNALAPFSSWKINILLILELLIKWELTLSESTPLILSTLFMLFQTAPFIDEL